MRTVLVHWDIGLPVEVGMMPSQQSSLTQLKNCLLQDAASEVIVPPYGCRNKSFEVTVSGEIKMGLLSGYSVIILRNSVEKGHVGNETWSRGERTAYAVPHDHGGDSEPKVGED